ncbi:UTP7 [Ecytonucleospora hepatopenaei]|uniref:UTP7 n=1 Tax=Ecytonucleospora hepatopenaei TaxID=646526 RepID=A0A1W0E868_9MICR|nr:hypothetical protein EHP00_2558 [Ecytonucleospora hepatopenaei]OQS55592.1 UTP7 [Ecytonucleospora hepatopenaei]
MEKEYKNLVNFNKKNDKLIKIHEEIARKKCDFLLEEKNSVKIYTQKYLKENVNLYTAEKAFDLDLEDKPLSYQIDYTRNGSHSLIYNNDGYISSFNTQKLNVDFEIENVGEKIHTATYLHSERYIAVSQRCLFVYDNFGQELNAVREIKNCKQMEFLPNHFLLGCVCHSNESEIKYLDTSTGEIISTMKIGFKPVATTSFDGLVLLGDKNGCVEMKAPKHQESLIKIKVGKNMKEMKVSYSKLYVSTYDDKIKTFDLRNYFKPLREFKTHFTNKMTVSKNETIALSQGKNINIIKEGKIVQKCKAKDTIGGMCFNPFEDILTCVSRSKYENFIIPNCTDPGYNSEQVSPFASSEERREREVKHLLEKIPPELISYNSEVFNQQRKSKKVKPTETYR